jgi:beta-glucosidase
VEPALPFGFGLSYTTFEYGDVRVDAPTFKPDATITVAFTVKNTGDCAGKEVVQVYASETKPVVDRPPKELVGFAKVLVPAGETAAVSIPIPAANLAYYDPETHQWHLRQGQYTLHVAASSRDIRATVSVACSAPLAFRK